MTHELSQLELFVGELNAGVARVYARFAIPDGEGHSLSGRLVGPFSEFGETLATSTPFRDLGPGETLLAQAILTEPCTWSPRSPSLYRAELTLTQESKVVGRANREIAIRQLAPRKAGFYLDGKRWVPRAVDRRLCPADDLSQWREQAAALLIDCSVSLPADDLLRRAAGLGVPIIGDMRELEGNRLVSRLRRLAACPAVCMAILGELTLLDEATLRSSAPNVLLGARAAGGPAHRPPARWLDFLVLTTPLADGRIPPEDQLLPLLALRDMDPPLPLAEARAACDRLQRDWAAAGDLAGYLVSARGVT